jgi:hypothetical protein
MHERLARTLIGRLRIAPWKGRGRLFGGDVDGQPTLAGLKQRMAGAPLRLELRQGARGAYSPAPIYTGESVVANKEQKRSNREAKKPKQKKKGADKRAAGNKGLTSKA